MTGGAALHRLALPLLFLLLAAVGRAPDTAAEAAPDAFLERLPRAWCGVFRWDGDPREQHITILFRRAVLRADGRIDAGGPGLVRYQDEPPRDAVEFHMRAVVDPATRRIEMFELIDVPRSDYVTDGSHVGELAADLGSMRLVWTTRGTGRRGSMELHARPVRAELTQTCAPPSS